MTRQSWITGVVVTAFLLTALPSFGEPKPFDLNQYKNKVVYLDFWASWCVPCRDSFPWLNKMQEKYKEDGLVVIGINLDESPKDAEAFLNRYPANFEIVYDPKGEYATHYQLPGMPTAIIFDRNGQKAYHHIGFNKSDEDESESKLIKALNP